MVCSTLPIPFASMENDTFLNTKGEPLYWGRSDQPSTPRATVTTVSTTTNSR